MRSTLRWLIVFALLIGAMIVASYLGGGMSSQPTGCGCYLR